MRHVLAAERGVGTGEAAAGAGLLTRRPDLVSEVLQEAGRLLVVAFRSVADPSPGNRSTAGVYSAAGGLIDEYERAA